MDPALLQSSSSLDETKPSAHTAESASSSVDNLQKVDSNQASLNGAANGSACGMGDNGSAMEEDDSDGGGGDGVKRPRLRLAHACDRCRKRKIRCDTQQPCGPCSATKNECTFNTPSRRVAKPKSSEARSSSVGVKRPHSPSRSGSSSAYQASLEARLATLESLLRDVPANVHNEYLSTLDARLGAGHGAGLAQGKGDGVGISSEALGAAPILAATSLAPLLGGLKTDATLTSPWQSNGLSGIMAGGRSMRRREDRGVDEMARRMEHLSFFYEDEIGQAKWQGESFVRQSMLTLRCDLWIPSVGITHCRSSRTGRRRGCRA